MKSCLLCCLLLVMGPLQAEIYKWTDANGNVNFSDKPQPGAKEVILPKVQTYSSPDKLDKSVIEALPEPVNDVENTSYKTFDIVSPEDQSTIRNPEGAVSVQLEVNPSLKKGDKVQMIFDGSLIDKPRRTTVFALQSINRGSHTLAAQVIDAQGQLLNTSKPITFYMMPPRVGMGKGSP